MSFFFSDKKKKAAVAQKTKSQKPQRILGQSKDTLNRLGCKVCPLDKAKNCTPKMLPDLADQTDIYVLGAQPNEQDDKKGQVFSSEAGLLLRSIVGRIDYVSFDNCIRDYGEAAPWVAMECCRSLVTASIEQAKPKLIIGLGILPLQWMLNSSDMIGLRGRVFAVKVGQHSCYFMPTYDPEFVISTAFDKKNPLRSKLGHCLKFDIAKAKDLALDLDPPKIDTPEAVRAGIQPFNGKGGNQLQALLKLMGEAARAPERAIDIEATGLKPWSTGFKVLTVALSYGSTNFSFAIDHPKAGWNKDQRAQIIKALKSVLEAEGRLIAHNAPFEVTVLIALLGKEAIFHDVWECTMMQAHFLDERRGKRGGTDDQFQPNPYQALDFLVKQYFGLPYKALFKLDRKNMLNADLDETLLYNGADTKYTLRLYHLQKKLLQQIGLLKPYRNTVMRQPTVALMQSIGIDIDQIENKRLEKKLAKEIKDVEKRINSLREVEAFIAKRKAFNPASQPDVITIFKDYIKVGSKLIGDDGKESVDKGILAKIDHPLAKYIEEFRNRSKLKSTYIDPFTIGKGAFVWPDGKIHPSCNTTFAETGRTSCTAYWTPVLTKRGEVQIKDVIVGDLVWTHKGRWKPVTKLWRKGWEVMLNVRLSNGSILTCTRNHRLLNANNQWVTAGEIYGLFQEMDKQTVKSRVSIGNVSKQGNVFSEGNSQLFRNNNFKCLVGYKELPSEGRIQSPEKAEVLYFQNWRKESNEGAYGGKISLLERRNRRWSRIQNHTSQWEKNSIPSPHDDEGFGAVVYPERMGSSSHRHKPAQQRIGQSSFNYGEGPQDDTFPSTTGFKVITIEEIEVGRSCEVFDITVADDSSYLTCGVISHNSDEPNNQNWPSRNDKWVRKQIVAAKGHVLVAFDFGQLEACTAAMCTKDAILVKALWEDYDIHMEWAIKAAHKYPKFINGIENLKDKDVMKKFRSLIKNKLVFPVIFGASNTSVAGYLNAPQDPIDSLMKEFWRTFDGLYSWQKGVMNDYYEFGFVSSPTGRRRHYPLTKNQAINHPIQSVACDIVCDAMCRMSVIAADTGKWYLHPIMNIHDDLTFNIPDDPQILEEAIETIYKVMLSPNYKFINVPLSVSCSVGNNWLEMEEVGKFWSNKDL